MAEADKKPDLIQEYLRRLKIQQKSGSFDDYAERLTHLSAIRDVLAALSAEGYASSEGTTLLGTHEQSSESPKWGPPDFVILREDVLIYLYLITGPIRELGSSALQAIWNDLRENPALSAVAVCWPEQDYPCAVIDSFAIRNYLERPAPVYLPEKELAPLVGAIEGFFRAQLVDWNLSPTSLQLGSGQRIREIGSALYDHISKTLAFEKSKNYEIPEKVTALSRISPGAIDELVKAITTMIASEDTSTRRMQELEDLIESLCKR